MANVNKVILIGNITRDIETRFIPSGSAVAEVGLAVNRTYKKGEEKMEETTFVDVTFWGKQAETLGEYAKKGSPLYIEGRLTMDTWDDKETGKKRSKLKVTGENFQFLGGGKASEGERQQSRPAPAMAAAAPEEDGGIPF